MKRQRAKPPSDSIRTYHYNTRSSSRHESCNTDKVEKASLRVTRRRKKVSDDRSTSLDLLPVDLIMEILKRLPVKTLARFLCVSKFWASIIRRRDFMKVFVSEFCTRPGRLFFNFKGGEDCFIFSSLQTQTPGDSTSIAATHNVTHPSNHFIIDSSSVHGLICYGTASGSGLVVYNSTTKRSITLPEFEPGSFVTKHFLGYDPIDGVYKVLCITGPKLVFPLADAELVRDRVFHVLTLGNESSWKIIENSHTHFPLISKICINGVVYYEAYSDTHEITVMSFDVRFEKFHLIKGFGGADFPHSCLSTMVRYEGKLAIISTKISANGGMVLWVLEDALKHKWLKKVFVLPNSWTSLAQPICTSSHKFQRFVNVTDAGELILAPTFLHCPPYYVLYYDPKTNTMRKVVVDGISEHKDKILRRENGKPCFLFYLFSSQVESLMFL